VRTARQRARSVAGLKSYVRLLPTVQVEATGARVTRQGKSPHPHPTFSRGVYGGAKGKGGMVGVVLLRATPGSLLSDQPARFTCWKVRVSVGIVPS